MSKLPIIKSPELIRVLRKLGFFQHKEHGSSHLVFKHSDGRRTTISRHSGKDIPRGTLKAILKDINLPNDKFIKILKD